MKWEDLPAELRDNPIFEFLRNPQNIMAYDAVDPAHVEPALDFVFKYLDNQLESVKRNKNQPSVKNTIIPLDEVYRAFSNIENLFYILVTRPNAAQRKKFIEYNVQVEAKCRAFESKMRTDDKLFRRVEDVYLRLNEMRLSEDRRRTVEVIYKDFLEHGAHLEPTRKFLMAQIEKRKAELSHEIEELAYPSSSATVYWPANRSVEGIPADVLARSRQYAEEEFNGNKKGWLFSSEECDEILATASNRDLREKIWCTFWLKATQITEGEEVPPLLKKVHELLSLQYEEAKLMGFKSFAEQEFSKLHIENQQEVKGLFKDLLRHAVDNAQQERSQLLALAHDVDGLDSVEPWDEEYYKNLLRAQVLGFVEEDLKPFFEFNRVMDATIAEMEKIWGVQFIENTDYSREHPTVKMYDVYSTNGKSYKGVLVIDPYNRKGKEDADQCPQVQDIYRTSSQSGQPQSRVACIQLFYDEPTKSKPTLLEPSEISETLFHEFGHAMHHLLNKSEFAHRTSFEAATDVLELPSTLCEHWGRQKEFLEKIASHHKTGEPLHGDVIDAYLESRKFFGGMQLMQDIRYCMLDIEWHNNNPNNMPTIAELEERVRRRYHHSDDWYGDTESLSMTHIFGGGYDAVYMGYLLSETRAAEIFEKFKREGIHSRTRLQQLRKAVEGGRHIALTAEFNELTKGALKSRALLRARGLLSSSFNYGAVPTEAVESFVSTHSKLRERLGFQSLRHRLMP